MRTRIAAVLTILALLLVWVALVAPNQPSRLTPGAFVRLPLEGLVVVALALVLPATARRLLAWVVGPALGLLVIVKILDFGFFTTFDRPFDPVADWSYTGIGIETLRDSIGRTGANLAVVGAAVLGVAVFVLTTLAVLRLTRVAAGHRRWSLQAVAALGAVWVLCWAFGAQLVSDAPIASASAADLAVDEVRAVRAGLQDNEIFADEIGRDRYRNTPGDQLLTGLRGKDVIVAFVESYGRVAVEDSSFSPRIDAALDKGTKRMRAAGFSSRSAFLTSSTFGGASWLAHSTLHSGLWVNSQRRYYQLVKTDRFTLSRAFKRAGWRTVDDVPSNNRDWPQGSSFYRYDKVYDRRNLGYRGPRFAYASMPDQYVLVALQRLELAKTRPPAHLRGGRPGVEPRAVDPHPAADRLERGRRRLGLQQHSGGRGDEGRALERPRTGACGVRPVDRVHPERPVLLREALRRRGSGARRAGRPSALDGRHRAGPESRRADLGHRPRPGGDAPDRRVGVGRRHAARPGRAGLADERLPRPLPQRIRLAAGPGS